MTFTASDTNLSFVKSDASSFLYKILRICFLISSLKNGHSSLPTTRSVSTLAFIKALSSFIPLSGSIQLSKALIAVGIDV